MKRSLLKSNVVLKLEDNIKQFGHKAVDEFLCNLRMSETPIIEIIENDNESSLVTFIYEGDKACKSVLFIPEIGRDRYKDNYKDFQMERIMGTELWFITYEIRNNIRLLYYFSPNDPLDNNWGERFDNRLVHDKFNNRIFILQDGEREYRGSCLEMPKAPEHIWTKKQEGIRRGRVEEYKFESVGLKDKRRIRIYTPYGYSEKEKPYGFMVLTDGNDYISVLSATETLDKLITYEKIPPISAVFIDSVEETREEELMCSDSFCEVISKELIPWVRQNYNISENPKDAIICGLSLGGLTAAYLAFNYPKIFGNVLSQSGSYWYKSIGFSTTKQDCWMGDKFKNINKLPLRFYLDVGVLEHQEMIYANINLRDILLDKGYHVDFQWFNSSHDYLSWGETFANGLISLIGK